MKRWGIVGTLLLLLAACGNAHGGQTAATTTVPVARGDRYLELVEPVNCVLGEAAQFGNTPHPTLAAVKAMAAKVADAEQHFVHQLKAERWPPDVQPAIDRLADATSEQADVFDRMSKAQTMPQADTIATTVNGDTAQQAVNDVRSALHLEHVDADTPACPGHGG